MFGVPFPHIRRVKKRIGGSGIDNDEVEPAGLLHRIGGSSVNFSAVELTPGRHPG
jgi:hypothetical protein